MTKNISEDIKLKVKSSIEILIRHELDKISRIYQTDIKSGFQAINFLSEKWNLFKLEELLPYYLELKQEINLKIKKEIKF